MKKVNIRVFPSGYDSYSEGKICPSEFFLQSMSHSLLFTFFPYETTTKKKIFVPFEFVENTRTNEKMVLLYESSRKKNDFKRLKYKNGRAFKRMRCM